MAALQAESRTSLVPPTLAHTRSPSPALPGAWPHTPAHKRAQTCPDALSDCIPPPLVSPSTTSPEPLHLARVVDFHQRLSLTISGCATDQDDPGRPFVAVHSADQISSFPSDTSNFTKYTHDGNSSSLADTSLHTSSPSLTPELQHNPQICIHSDASPTEDNRLSPFFSSSAFPSPLSPIIFPPPSPNDKPIPVASTKPFTRHAYTSSGYSTSSEEDYFGPLRAPNRPRARSMSPSSRYLSSAMTASRRVSPSVEELAPPTIPMLTGLSLPGTPDTSLVIERLGSPDSPISPPDNDIEWTLSLSAMTPTESESMHLSPTSPSLSLSPTPSFRAELNLDATEHVVNLPVEASAFASSALPTPASPSSEIQANNSLETSAAEYAAAIMSSVWSFEDSPLPPIDVQVPHHDLNDVQDQPDLDSSQGHRLDLVREMQRKKGITAKLKRMGGRFRLLLSGKLRQELSGEMRRPQSAPSIRTTTFVHTSERPRLPSLRLDLEERVLPRPMSPPRSSTEASYMQQRPANSSRRQSATAQDPRSIDITPDIQILPPSMTSASEHEPAPKSSIPAAPTHQKTLSEIKASRRFSFSAIANLGRPSSPPPTPPPILVATRRRPVSARLALPTNPRRRESLHFEEDARPRPVSRSSRPDPPGLEPPSLEHSGGRVEPDPEPVASLRAETSKAKDLKKSRRFSLSVLSSLTSGGGLRPDGASGWVRSSRS